MKSSLLLKVTVWLSQITISVPVICPPETENVPTSAPQLQAAGAVKSKVVWQALAAVNPVKLAVRVSNELAALAGSMISLMVTVWGNPGNVELTGANNPDCATKGL